MTWWTIDETHDPARTSWVSSANGHRDFPVQNLPLAAFTPPAGGESRIGIAIGDLILDLAQVAHAGLLPERLTDIAHDSTLNRLLAVSPEDRMALRRTVSDLLSDAARQSAIQSMLHPAEGCTLHLPARIGDYTDFYVGIHHAGNVGRQFRPDNPLLPNYKHVPIAYHGRASSIRASGIPVVRPRGQRRAADADAPIFAPSARLDYELEMGVWIGSGNRLGEPIPVAEAARHIAGFCLLNDWSARDIQGWEYQPLGPFLSKNFHTTISPWIVTPEALAPFRMPQPPRPDGDPQPLPYLQASDDRQHGALAVTLEVHLTTAAMRGNGQPAHRLSRGPASNMYWTVQQMVTHHASNGCNLSPGDLLGTGTISAPDREGFGSLLELSEGGKSPVVLPGGETRTFLEDGDEVSLSATASAPGYVSIGFGECRARIMPAR